MTLSPTRAAAVSASAGLVLVAAAIAVPRWTGEDVHVHWPPLHADWDPRLGVLTLPAVALGLILWLALPVIAARASWRVLLLSAFVATWLWTIAVAMTEGTEGLSRVFERPQEYIYDAERVGSIHAMLQTFVERIPYAHPENWRTHTAGHPPGALLYFVLLERLGITDPFWIGVVCVTIGSTAIVAVLVTLRALGSLPLARSAMPWIVLAPSVVWMGVDGDAVFTAVAAWGLALLALAATSRHRIVPAVGAGLVLGLCVYLSYGLVLLGILALTVLVIARAWRPLPWALGAALLVAGAFTFGGFSWWEAYPVLRVRYYDGIASQRPYAYWVWADIAAWTFTVGLAVWAAFPRAARSLRDNALAQLAAAAMVTILVASLSGMSKAEVERVFLPFTIWIVALPALLPSRWQRPLLLSQAILALLVQQLLLTRW